MSIFLQENFHWNRKVKIALIACSIKIFPQWEVIEVNSICTRLTNCRLACLYDTRNGRVCIQFLQDRRFI